MYPCAFLFSACPYVRRRALAETPHCESQRTTRTRHVRNRCTRGCECSFAVCVSNLHDVSSSHTTKVVLLWNRFLRLALAILSARWRKYRWALHVMRMHEQLSRRTDKNTSK